MSLRWLVLPVAVLLAISCAWGQDGDAVVLVNGRPITKSQMVNLLMEARGLQIMQQLIVLELAKEETRRLKIRVTPDDVQREFERALTKIAPAVDAKGQALSAEEKQKSLEMLLQQKGVTLTEFKIGMERNAHLRKVVERSFHIEEATLREEFARVYGERVEVRHIQVGDMARLHEALNRLEKGVDFGDVARAVSQNPDTASSGGVLAPFAFNEEVVAPILREAAFSMKPGEVSKPIRVGPWWHILKLERRLPAPDVRFEDVREQVEQSLRDHAVPDQMNRLIMDLFAKADVKVLDANLKQKYDKLLKENAALAP
jgi:foldase protein PrsA